MNGKTFTKYEFEKSFKVTENITTLDQLKKLILSRQDKINQYQFG